MSLWDSVKVAAEKAGHRASIAGQRGKLKGEMMLIDRKISSRQQAFGVELYDHIGEMTSKPEFYASDDKLTSTLRPPLLTAQREISALLIKRGKLKEQLAQAEVTRKSAFPNPAENFGQKVVNAGKTTGFVANEAKLKTELSMVESQIKGHKQQFGLELYAILVHLEDSEEWLPTDRDIRSIYDQARRDVESLKTQRAEKKKEFKCLGGHSEPETEVVDTGSASQSTATGSVYAAPTPSVSYAKTVPPQASAVPMAYAAPISSAPPSAPAVPVSSTAAPADPFAADPFAGINAYAAPTPLNSSAAPNPSAPQQNTDPFSLFM